METTSIDIKELNERIQRESAFVDMITLEMDKVIVGQKHMVERLLIGLLSVIFLLFFEPRTFGTVLAFSLMQN